MNKPYYKCLLCNRDKFQKKSPHNCGNNYRKHKIKWQIINNLGFSVLG